MKSFDIYERSKLFDRNLDNKIDNYIDFFFQLTKTHKYY